MKPVFTIEIVEYPTVRIQLREFGPPLEEQPEDRENEQRGIMLYSVPETTADPAPEYAFSIGI
jgi:hypothetical protein